MSAPWLIDPMFGGMSPYAAQRSYEAWVRNGRKPMSAYRRPAESDAQIALRKRQIEVQLSEYEQALIAYARWFGAWRVRQRHRGFRCVERQGG